MNRDRDTVDKALYQHLGLFGASAGQLKASRERIRERLHLGMGASPTAIEIDARPSRGVPYTWRVGLSVAAAAILIMLVSTVRWDRAATLAVVDATGGTLSALSDGVWRPLRFGDAIAAFQVIRATGIGGAMLALADGSRIEVRSESELLLVREDDGLGIRLQAGGIIVNAAKQKNRHLYVRTKDITVAVVGTVFAVNAADDGARVTVIEGEVRVREGASETTLRPGEQVSTSPTLAARPLSAEVAWSRNSDAYRTILAAFAKGIAETAGPLTTLADRSSRFNAGGQAGATAVGQEFEEASIRECDPDNLPPTPAGARGGGANSFQMTPGRTYGLCLTLGTLVRTAYGYGPVDINPGGRGRGMTVNVVYGLGVEDGRRVRGGPDWVRSEYYTIEAVAAGPAEAETMRGPMLRNLLERRFGLKAHIEIEQIPAFAMTVAPGGLKMKEGTCTPPDASFVPPRGTREMVEKNLAAARRGATTAAPCGFAGAANGPNLLFVGAGAGMPSLSGFLGVPVIDKTGIPNTVRFNYALEFLPDDSTPGPLGRLSQREPRPPIAGEPSTVTPAPSLFTALEQQLGLKLEPAQAPREFIVIDHVERPTPN
jgi:uncharacterized protein (TIGR03435 family)